IGIFFIILSYYSLLQLPKVRKGKKAKGKKVVPTLAVLKKQETMKVVNLPFAKFGTRQDFLSFDRTSSPKGTSIALSNGPIILGCSSREPSSISS
uniref:Uncharacterized protein n=1 Tax=Pongo abelii TaxID=9601 RepID=H2PRN3_PONAB